jgi:hypothetical protein
MRLGASLAAVLLASPSVADIREAHDHVPQDPGAARHRLSLGVAPVHFGVYLGDFGRDNPPQSDSNFDAYAAGATVSGRYTFTLVRGLDVGGEAGVIKPYYVITFAQPDMAKLTHPWFAAVVRPHLWLGESTDLALFTRIGVAAAYWGGRAGDPTVSYGGGLEVRHWLNDRLALGGELDVMRVRLELSGSRNEDRVRASGTVFSPCVRITWALGSVEAEQR